ncbi:GGDEF domain-containing protein [Streptomyces durbertensis]|uniref:GGDEF domain-containing protein n=1 Tax=Streptomyces durbertensis TaxID=2448886 RepID=A0ABR6EKC8_9ACTN|nr:GGDEF domain-containing protein [Streptomyces durbertensis]MBB1245796.1 GGDEF domain-containing protein [Streptomyces durbertensis]
MSTLLPTLAAAAPVAAGWSVHSVWLRRQLHRARRDPLTGLPTRAAFERQAARLVARRPAVVLVIDLDGFKHLNDHHGHSAGDAVLRGTASALAELTDTLADRRGAVVARLGGDEFAAALPLPDPVAVPWLLRGLHDCLCAPLWRDGHTVSVGASIGACLTADLPAPGLSLALRRADEAMYTAKRGGGGWYVADGPAPTRSTANGRRAGRRGTHHHSAVPGGEAS